MPLIIVRNDITKMNVDAIVNPTNSTLSGGGGVDGTIHSSAGVKLLNACKKLNGCETGSSKITKGYDLPCKFVIHTVGPVWTGGNNNETELLKSCYQSSLSLALKKGLKSIAFPLISTGTFKFPKDISFKIASETIENFLTNHDMTVYIVVFDSETFSISKKLYEDVSQYIDDNYASLKYQRVSRTALCDAPKSSHEPEMICYSLPSTQKRNLEDILVEIEDTFSQSLMKMIDQKHMSDTEVYKKANVDRKLFSKIRSNKNYKPSKSTVLAFCFSLELNLDETKDLLMRAGFALSRSNKFDIIIEYFINNRIYNIFEVNETLFAFEQNLLGV